VTRRTLLPLVALLGLAAPAAAQDSRLPKPAGPTPGRPAGVDFDQRLGEQVPLDLSFRDETGHAVTLRDCVAGKPTILVLAYYRCPKLCNEVLNGVLDAIRAIPYTAGKDFSVVTVSFDPKELPDIAAAKKKAYLAEYGRPGADWRFLTGEKGPIEELTRAVGFKYEYDKVFKEYNHASGIMVLTPDGRLARYFYGINYDGDDGKATDLRLSLVEAGEGKIGSATDKLLLLCYRFEPSHNKYAFNVLWAVRTGGIVTVLALAATVVIFLRRERRKAAATAAAAVAGPTDNPPGVV
jgi:protein SCO1/2